MQKNGKMAKMRKFKWGRLGRYKNRNGARKKVLNSWDDTYRLVISNDAFGDRKNITMVSMFLDFGAGLSTYYCWRLIFWCFSVRGGSEKLNFALKNKFTLKFWSKTFFCHSWQFLWKMKKWDSLKSFEKNKIWISPKCSKSMPWNFIFDGFWIKSSPILTRARFQSQHEAQLAALERQAKAEWFESQKRAQAEHLQKYEAKVQQLKAQLGIKKPHVEVLVEDHHEARGGESEGTCTKM